MKKKLLDKKAIAAYRRRWQFMLADNGGERPTPPEPEPTDWNMRVVAHPNDGYEMPTTTGNFTLVEQRGDVYYYQHDGSSSTGRSVVTDSNYVVSDVTFKNCEHINNIGWSFLPHLHSKTIDLSPFRNVTTIEGGFLNYSDFEYIDLSPLSNVVNIGLQYTNYGNGFLAYSKSLKSIDITPLQGVKNIGQNFLNGCVSLVSVTLPTFNNLENKTTTTLYVLDYFLYNCKSLVGDITINAPKLEKIGEYFLGGCVMVDSVTINAPKINSIGNNFLSGCRNITSIKVPWVTIPTTSTSGFITNVPSTCSIEVPCEAVSTYWTTQPWSGHITKINGGDGCEEPERPWNMKVVANPEDGYSMPTTTGNFTLVKQDGNEYFYHHDGSDSTGTNVLYDANNSTHWNVNDVTFKDCEHINTIGNYFLAYCGNLTEINISTLNNVTKIGNAFLAYCTNLTEINLSVLSNTTSVGSTFLGYCSTLQSVNLSALSNTTSIGGTFLAGCVALTSLDISLPNVTTIGTYFLSGCEALTSLELSLPNVTNISDYFVRNCSNLTSLNLSKMGNVTSIGRNFLYGSTKLNSLNVPWTTIPTMNATAKLYFMLNVPTTCSIEVPCESVDTYKKTSPWKDRASHIVGDCPPSEYNMKVVANPDDGSMPQTTGNFTLIKTIGDTHYYSLNDGATSTGNDVLNSSHLHITDVEFVNCDNITEIGFNFLCNSDITTFDVTPFKNVTHIKSEFLDNTKIESIDFTPMVNKPFVENNFMAYSGSLVYAKIPWSTPFAPFIGLFYGTPSNFEIHVPCGSGNDYKQSWEDHADAIVEDC